MGKEFLIKQKDNGEVLFTGSKPKLDKELKSGKYNDEKHAIYERDKFKPYAKVTAIEYIDFEGDNQAIYTADKRETLAQEKSLQSDGYKKNPKATSIYGLNDEIDDDGSPKNKQYVITQRDRYYKQDK